MDDLVRRLDDALKLRRHHQAALDSITSKLPWDNVIYWEHLCKQWYNAPNPKDGIFNPFPSSNPSLMENLSIQDLEGRHSVQVDFILLGLTLRNADEEVAALEGQPEDPSNVFLRRFQEFRTLQSACMPGLGQYLNDKSLRSTGEESKVMGLWLPSDIDSDSRSTVCGKGIIEIEDMIREVRCVDMLAFIRHCLRLKTRMLQFHKCAARGQCFLETSCQVTERILTQANDLAKEYRSNRDALMRLRGEGQWEHVLRALSDCDLRVLEPGSTQDCVDETVLWFWSSPSVARENNRLLRGEWCRCWGRLRKSIEEVDTLQEELRRSI